MQKFSFLISLLLLTGVLRAQNSLYLSTNASLFIGAGTPLAVDSLVLTPSSAYTITGANSIQRSAATLHGGGSPYIKRVYQWTNTLPPFTGSLSFYYRDGELNGINEGQLTLNVHNGTNWSAYINNVIRNNTDNVVTTTLSGVALNELTLASLQSPLPMVWLDVAAQRRNSVIQISWQTAEEINGNGYQVEKSTNGIDWSKLGSVINAYNTPGPNHYNQTDPTLPTAISFYRVRQTDLDGKYGYSKMVSVKSDKSNGVWLYPIPTNNVLTIVAGGNMALKSATIYNTAGVRVAAVQPINTTSHTMDVHHLASGNYTTVIVLTDNSTITRNFIKQ
jgi:hypothetical protein